MLEPHCVVPAGDRTALVGVDSDAALVSLASLPFAWEENVFAFGEGRVACAHRRDGGPRCSVLELIDVREGSARVTARWDSDEGVHITSLAIAAGHVFVGAYEGLFAFPLDTFDGRGPSLRYDTATLADGLGVDSLVVDGDRLLALERATHAPAFVLFDLRRLREPTAARRVTLEHDAMHAARLGGAFILLESRARVGGAFYDNVHLFDRATLAPLARVYRTFGQGDDDEPIDPTPGWAGVAVVDDTLVVAEQSGDVLVVPCAEFMRGFETTWLPTAPDQRARAPYAGVIETLVPIPYRRAAIAIIRAPGERTRSVRVWTP